MATKTKTPESNRPDTYLGLARKYRPRYFSEMVGQEAVAQSLMNAVAGGRLVHGHLLSGPRGVGKTTSARILARCLNCEKGPAAVPCGECTHCRAIEQGSDLDVIEFDAASHTQVEKMRELLENVVLLPFASRFKVYIIDEVHMLSTASFNALLKTLEEPPAHVVFVFATTEFDKIPETVRSRCSIHNFRRLTVEDIIRRLGEVSKAEGIQLDEQSAREIFGMIAQSADGGMRDALVAFDQLLAMTDGKPTAEAAERLLGLTSHSALADAVRWLAEGNAKALMQLIDDLVSRGRSLERFVKGVLSFLHEIMLLQADPQTSLISISGQSLDSARELSKKLSQPAVFNLLNQMFELEERMKRTTHGRFLLEFAFLRAAAIKPVIPIEDVMNRLRALPDTGAESSAPKPNTNTDPIQRAQAVAERAAPVYERPAAAPSRLMATPRLQAAALREGDGESEAGQSSGSNSLAGLTRDEITNLIAPMLPEAYQFLARYLKLAVSIRAEEASMWVQWAKDDRVGSRMLAKNENREALEKILGQICGRPISVKSSISSEVAIAPNSTKPAPRAASGSVMRDSAAVDELETAEENSTYEFHMPENYTPSRERAEMNDSDSENPGPDISENSVKKLLGGNADLARRARMVRDLLGGRVVDASGRQISI